MHYIIEAFFVGVYSYSIAAILLVLNHNYQYSYTYLLFCTGYLKHFLGYVVGIHAYYCKYGYSCNNIQKIYDTSVNKNVQLVQVIGESIGEGLAFIVAGTTLHTFIKNKLFIVFLVGCIFHILFEMLGIHSYFCIHRCSMK